MKTGKRIQLVGVNSKPVYAYGWSIELRIRGSTSAPDVHVFHDVWVYALDGPLPAIAQLLIGQLSGFEGKPFVHLNWAKNRRWMLRP